MKKILMTIAVCLIMFSIDAAPACWRFPGGGWCRPCPPPPPGGYWGGPGWCRPCPPPPPPGCWGGPGFGCTPFWGAAAGIAAGTIIGNAISGGYRYSNPVVIQQPTVVTQPVVIQQPAYPVQQTVVQPQYQSYQTTTVINNPVRTPLVGASVNVLGIGASVGVGY